MTAPGRDRGRWGAGPLDRVAALRSGVLRFADWLEAPPRALRLTAGATLAVLLANLLYHGQQSYAAGLFRPPLDKIAHVALFATVGALLWIAAGARRMGVVVGGALLLGSVDEAMQALNPGRSVDGSDLLADALGAVLGVMSCRWSARLAREHARR